MGGGTDINLVAQDRALNISGPWRRFERYAARNPGTFFAVQVEYADDSQRPSGFVYSIVKDGTLVYRHFDNR